MVFLEFLVFLEFDFCRAQYHKSNIEDAIYTVVADGQHTQHRAVPYVEQYTHLGS